MWVAPPGAYVWMPPGAAPLPAALPPHRAGNVWPAGQRLSEPTELMSWGPEELTGLSDDPLLIRPRLDWPHLMPLLNRSAPARYLSQYNSLPTAAGSLRIEHEARWRSVLPLLSAPQVAKAPFSSSGRSVKFLPFPLPADAPPPFPYPFELQTALKRESEWGLEYYIGKEGQPKLLWVTRFTTAARGAFGGSLAADPQRQYAALAQRIGAATLSRLIEDHLQFLRREAAPYYRGYLGIDVLLYKKENHCLPNGGKQRPNEANPCSDAGAEWGVHPFVELNLRYTMGCLAPELWCNQRGMIRERLGSDEALLCIQPIRPGAHALMGAEGTTAKGTSKALLLSTPDSRSRFVALLLPAPEALLTP